VFFDRFNVLISKINLKKFKKYYSNVFPSESTLKNNRYHTPNHPLKNKFAKSRIICRELMLIRFLGWCMLIIK
jgi:hypothetical protein